MTPPDPSGASPSVQVVFVIARHPGENLQRRHFRGIAAEREGRQHREVLVNELLVALGRDEFGEANVQVAEVRTVEIGPERQGRGLADIISGTRVVKVVRSKPDLGTQQLGENPL